MNMENCNLTRNNIKYLKNKQKKPKKKVKVKIKRVYIYFVTMFVKKLSIPSARVYIIDSLSLDIHTFFTGYTYMVPPTHCLSFVFFLLLKHFCECRLIKLAG